MRKRKALLVTAFAVAGAVGFAACSAKQPSNGGGGPTGTGTPTSTPTVTVTATPTPIPSAPFTTIASWPGLHGETLWYFAQIGFSGTIDDFGYSDGVADTCTGGNVSLAFTVTAGETVVFHVGGEGGCNSVPASGESWSFDYDDLAVTDCTGTTPNCVNSQHVLSVPVSAPNTFYNTPPSVLTLVSAEHSSVTGSLHLLVMDTAQEVNLSQVWFYTSGGAELFGCGNLTTTTFTPFASLSGDTNPALIQPCATGTDGLFNGGAVSNGGGQQIAGQGNYGAYFVGTYPDGSVFAQYLPMFYSTSQLANSPPP